MTQRATNNKRPRDNSEVDSPPRKMRGRGRMAQPSPVSSRPRSVTPPPLDPRRPTYFIPDDFSIKLNPSSPTTQKENALSAAVANSSLYKNALKKYADEYEKVVSLEDKSNGLEREKKILEEQVENLKAQLKARDSPLARSLSFAPPGVLPPTPAPVLTVRSEDVEKAARQSAELEELKKSVKKKENDIGEMGGRIMDLSSENEKLKNQLLFAQSQSSNHERTLALISNLFGIRHLLSTSGDLLVNRIESIYHQFRRDETARIDSNCAAKHQELWDNEVRSLRQLFTVECEKYRVAVVEEAKRWLEKGGVVVESQTTIPTMAPPSVVPVVVVSAPTSIAPEPSPASYFPVQYPTQVQPEVALSPVVESPITTSTLSPPIEAQIVQDSAVEMEIEASDVSNTAMDISAPEIATSTEIVIQSPITTPAPEPAAIRSIQTPDRARPQPAGQIEGPALFATPTGPSVATMLAEAKAANKGEKYITVVEDESKLLGPATISTPDQIAQRKFRAPKGRLQVQDRPIVQSQPQVSAQSQTEIIPATPIAEPSALATTTLSASNTVQKQTSASTRPILRPRGRLATQTEPVNTPQPPTRAEAFKSLPLPSTLEQGYVDPGYTGGRTAEEKELDEIVGEIPELDPEVAARYYQVHKAEEERRQIREQAAVEKAKASSSASESSTSKDKSKSAKAAVSKIVKTADKRSIEETDRDAELEQDMWEQFDQMDQEQNGGELANKGKMTEEKSEFDNMAASGLKSYAGEKNERAQAQAEEPLQDQNMEHSEEPSRPQPQSQPREQSQTNNSSPGHDTSLTPRLDALMMSPIPIVSGSSSSRVTVEPQPQRRSNRIATRQALWEGNKK